MQRNHNINSILTTKLVIITLFLLLFTQCKNNPTTPILPVPELTTTEVSSVTDSSAVSGGNITSDGGATVTARGVCWSTSQTPTISNNHTIDSDGAGTFTSEITGLNPATKYYVRAYATSSAGTGYGSAMSFTSKAILPTVTTSNISNITSSLATCGGTITSDGGATVTARGVCWGTTQTPTISENKTIDGDGVGTFTSEITGLISNTTYYVRAYAKNSIGVGYGNTISFITAVPETGTLTDIDDNVYKTVKIGDQWWLAENLKVTHYRNGEAIPNVTDGTQWSNLITGAYCAYNNDNGNISTYGLLYNWFAVDDNRNIAPAGWHVPTDEEWKQLEMYLGISPTRVNDTNNRGTDEGNKLKSTNGWHNGGNGTNVSGFSALPGGTVAVIVDRSTT